MGTFDPAKYVRRVGRRLVHEFENAGLATTPGQKGDVKEHSVRKELEGILPRGIGVGEGFVIDLSGNTSRQMDVILYERDLCPAFSLGGPEATYYPVEGVLAVGEIKSTIGKRELEDAFDKIRSVKALKRAFERFREEKGVYIGRRYGESGQGLTEGFHLDSTNLGDIFGFALAETSRPKFTIEDAKSDKPYSRGILGHYCNNVEGMGDDTLCPDMVVFLDGIIVEARNSNVGGHSGRYVPVRAKRTLPHAIGPAPTESPFGDLIKRLWHRYQMGLTAHIPLERYLDIKPEGDPGRIWLRIVNAPSHIEVEADYRTPIEHINNKLIPLSNQGR